MCCRTTRNMRWNITTKLFVFFLLGSLLLLVLSALLSRWSFERGLLSYVNDQQARQMARLAEPVEQLYRRTGSLRALQADPTRWQQLIRERMPWRPPPPPGGFDHKPAPDREFSPGSAVGQADCLDPAFTDDPRCRFPTRRKPPPRRKPGQSDDPLNVLARIALFDTGGVRIAGNPRAAGSTDRMPLRVDGELVGELRIEPLRELDQAIDREFVQRQSKTLAGIVIGLLLVSGLAALLFARLLTRPIQALLAGSQRIARGVYDQPVPVSRADELGELASSVNAAGQALQANREARQRWLADIAHELRTPLAILSGELQAIEDGVRPMNAQTRQSLQVEVQRLARLVRDLHELSMSDDGGPDYRREPVEVAVVLSNALDCAMRRLSDAGITLERHVSTEPILVTGDAGRLSQLFVNLLENTTRYTSSPGRLLVSCARSNDVVEIVFSDSSPGVPDEALSRLFDRLFRVDESRSRQTGGSGLGLAICQGIVRAHNGSINASHSPLGGLSIRICLPLRRQESPHQAPE